MQSLESKLVILVSGDRNWTNIDTVYRELSKYREYAVTLVHGGARGLDSITHNIALEFGWETKEYLAHWDKFGKAAGPIRNQEMLDKERPNFLLAFHPNIESSRGTKDMVNRATKAGIPVTIVIT